MHDVMTIATAFAQISAWMRAHGAPLLVDNLAPPASADRLAQAEAELGFALPADLRALWLLHDGQREEQNGFVEAYDLYSIALAIAERESVLMWLESAREYDATTMTAAELASDAWLPFAGRDSDSLAVSALSGRVFELQHDDPNPVFVADTIAAWATAFAARVVADDYRVEDGFGDYYLQRRDRAAEAHAHEARAQAERRQQSSPAALLAEAVSRQDAARGRDAVARARGESPAALAAVVAQLFASGASPALIADTLRVVLAQLSLTPAAWQIVVTGAEALGNNSIRTFALAALNR